MPPLLCLPSSLPGHFYSPWVKLSLPSISVVIIQVPGKDWPGCAEVLAWLQGQTIDPSAVEAVNRDRQNSSAAVLGPSRSE